MTSVNVVSVILFEGNNAERQLRLAISLLRPESVTCRPELAEVYVDEVSQARVVTSLCQVNTLLNKFSISATCTDILISLLIF